jgi:predicted nucleic acid-binding protein
VALTSRFLIDTSAAARMRIPHIGDELAESIGAGLVATTAVLDAEALYSARSADEFVRLRSERRIAFEYLPTNDADWQIAIDAQSRLAQLGRHRSVGIADMLTAVAAQAHRLTVLHYDADFETAATVLDFEHRWIAEPGTL